MSDKDNFEMLGFRRFEPPRELDGILDLDAITIGDDGTIHIPAGTFPEPQYVTVTDFARWAVQAGKVWKERAERFRQKWEDA